MSRRVELTHLATSWLTLWSAPVDWDHFDALHADDFIDHASANRPPTKAGFAQGLAAMVGAFPDLVTTVEDLGVGPTNRLTTITGIEIVGIRDGKIVERWGEWDITAHREVEP